MHTATLRDTADRWEPLEAYNGLFHLIIIILLEGHAGCLEGHAGYLDGQIFTYIDAWEGRARWLPMCLANQDFQNFAT